MLPFHRCILQFAWLLLKQNYVWMISDVKFEETNALNSYLGYDDFIHHYIVYVLDIRSFLNLIQELHYLRM